MPIRPPLPQPAEFGEPMAPAQESAETLRVIARRRSAPTAVMGEPGPSREDVDYLLALAARVPDHRKLEPWRFLVFETHVREKLGQVFADGLKAENPAASESELVQARRLPMRAPLIIAVISSPVEDPKKTPVWEQELSAGAVCQTLMIAANAMGWPACWLSEEPAYNRYIAEALGLTARERFAGFIYLGTVHGEPVERARPDMGKKVTRFT